MIWFSAQSNALELESFNQMWTTFGVDFRITIGNPERHVRKLSHCGRKQQ